MSPNEPNRKDLPMKMPVFLIRLKEQSEENPTVAIGLGIATVATLTKAADTIASVRSKNAYAKQVKSSTRKKNRK